MAPKKGAADIAEVVEEVIDEAVDEAVEEEVDEAVVDEAPPADVVVVEAEPSPTEVATDAIAFTEAVRAIAREEAAQVVNDRLVGYELTALSPGDVVDIAEEVAQVVVDENQPPPPEPVIVPDSTPKDRDNRQHWSQRKLFGKK